MSQAKKKPSAESVAVARSLEESGLRVRFFRGSAYSYDGAVYQKRDDGWLGQLVLRRMEANDRSVSARMVNEVIDLLRLRFYTNSSFVPPFKIGGKGETVNVISLANGLLDLSPLASGGDPRMLDFSDNWFMTGKAYYPYEPTATCEKFDKFLAWLTRHDDEVQELILQFMAYTLMPELQLQKFLILTGSGANGKSVLLHIWRRLLGDDNVASVTLERLTHNFSLAGLAEKRANIVSDLPEIDKPSEGVLKQIVDGSPLPIEQKYKPVYSAPINCRLIFATNTLPRFRDRSEGLWRRLIIVPCTAVVDETEAVESYEKTFWDETSGILNRVIAAGRRLVAAGRFVLPDRCLRANRAHKLEANPAAMFVAEHIQVSPGAFVTSKVIYQEYQEWCKRWGYTGVLSRENLFKELKKLRPSARRVRSGPDFETSFRAWGYDGIVCLYEDGEPPADDEEEEDLPTKPVEPSQDGPCPF